MLTRPPPSSIPDGPGVYIFRDVHGRPVYVGKAKSLRKRTANYFAADLAPKVSGAYRINVIYRQKDGDYALIDPEF